LNGIVLVPANRRAPPLPSTSRVISPTWVVSAKKVAVTVETTLVFGWTSKPKVVRSRSDVSVRDVKPSVQRTRGVDPSVSGGDPQDPQVEGVVKATRGMSNVRVTVGSLRDSTAEKSGAVMGISVVSAT